MRNRIGISSALLIVLTATLFIQAHGAAKDEKRATKIKNAIAKLGQGPSARVEVTLVTGEKVSGYVSAATEGSFTVVNADSTPTEIPYPSAKQVKGNNLSSGAKIAIGVGIFLAVFLIIGLAQ